MIGILSTLMGILIPAVEGVRRKAMDLKSANNMRQVITTLGLFANDNQDRYPPTLGYVGMPSSFMYYDVRGMVASVARTKGDKRNLSCYLSEYLPDGDVFQCPSTPSECKDLPDVWEMGESWGVDVRNIPYRGTYSLYWDWVGFIDSRNDGTFSTLFRGAKGPGGGKGYSKLLISDSFVLGDSDGLSGTQPSYTSCEWIDGAGGLPSEIVSGAVRAPRWRTGKLTSQERPNIRLRAGFTDGHVEVYKSAEAIRLRRPSGPDRLSPDPWNPDDDSYPGPGEFYLPLEAIPVR